MVVGGREKPMRVSRRRLPSVGGCVEGSRWEGGGDEGVGPKRRDGGSMCGGVAAISMAGEMM